MRQLSTRDQVPQTLVTIGHRKSRHLMCLKGTRKQSRIQVLNVFNSDYKILCTKIYFLTDKKLKGETTTTNENVPDMITETSTYRD